MLSDLLRRCGRWLMDDPARRGLYDAVNAGAQRALGTRIRSGPARGLRFRGGDTVGYVLGISEPPVQRALVAHLRPGDVYYDIGTHAGFLALLGSRIVGRCGQVHCFEPVSDSVCILTRNLESNDATNVQVHQLAVSDYEGEATMEVTRKNITARLLEAGAGERVRVVRLDSLTHLPAPHVVKIDVEGAEAQVLDGARELLIRARPVLVIEIHGDREAAVRSILREVGYAEPATIRDGGMPHLVAVPHPRW